MNEAQQQYLALLYLVTPLVLIALIVARLIARRRLRFAVIALVAWIVHICGLFVLVAPGLSGHWHPTRAEELRIDIVGFGGVAVVLVLVVLAFLDRAEVPRKTPPAPSP